MIINDPAINPIIGPTTCNFQVVGVVAAVVGTAVSLIGGMAAAGQQAAAYEAQAAAQEQQARQQIAIAQYNAQIARQNAEVQYQMAVYQAQTNAQIANINQATAISNAELAKVQAFGARQQYEQGNLNAKQQEIEAEAIRAQGREEARRKREENEMRISSIRAKYGASGVAFEGSPLVVLADAARLGETAVQDIAYATELQSRKEYREAELERFKASFSLIDEMGFNVQAANQQLQAQRFEYEANLYEYDQQIAGAKYRIGLNEARLVELGGEVQAYGYRAEAQQSRFKAQAARTEGMFSAISTGISGVGAVAGQLSGWGGGTGGGGGFGRWGGGGSLIGGAGRMPSYSSSYAGANAPGYLGYDRPLFGMRSWGA